MELTPDLLRTFVAAAQTGNFTQAAKQVNISQSAVSMQMRKLEGDLGKSLFTRMTRGVQLTADGEILLKYAGRLLRLHDKALASLSEPNLKGLIRLGSVEDYADLHFPGILKRFSEKYPLIQVDLFCDQSDELLKMFYSGKFDLCLRNAETVEPGGVFLRYEPLIWISPPDGEPEKRSPLPIAVFHDCLYRQWTEKVLKKIALSSVWPIQAPVSQAFWPPSKRGWPWHQLGPVSMFQVFGFYPKEPCRLCLMPW